MIAIGPSSLSTKELNGSVAAIALWFCLRLPSCGPGLNPKHTVYAFFNLSYWNCNKGRTKINIKRRIWPIYIKNMSIFQRILDFGLKLNYCPGSFQSQQIQFRLLTKPLPRFSFVQTYTHCSKVFPGWAGQCT